MQNLFGEPRLGGEGYSQPANSRPANAWTRLRTADASVRKCKGGRTSLGRAASANIVRLQAGVSAIQSGFTAPISVIAHSR